MRESPKVSGSGLREVCDECVLGSNNQVTPGDTFVLGCACFEVAKRGLPETAHLRE